MLGGAAVDFLAYYADLAIQMIEHPRNYAAWLALGSRIGDNILFEQYLLAACLAFHGGRRGSPFSDVHAAYLFPFERRRIRRAVGGADGLHAPDRRRQE